MNTDKNKATVSVFCDNDEVNLMELIFDGKDIAFMECFEFEDQHAVSLTNSDRGFIDNKWLVFALTVIPAFDSAIQMFEYIKGLVQKKVSEKRKLEKKTKITMKVTLPFFSYEKVEEIEIK